MFVLIRTITYASLFIGFVLVFLPARILGWAGIARPAEFHWAEVAGLFVGALGAALALWCVGAFAWLGKGTPAPFDPPRRLVIRGPYRLVRNPMCVGATLALAGAALYFRAIPLLILVCGFLLVTHLFIVIYEEPTLKRMFGPEYEAYYQRVHRWRPTWRVTR